MIALADSRSATDVFDVEIVVPVFNLPQRVVRASPRNSAAKRGQLGEVEAGQVRRGRRSCAGR
jgi:hypothetical protein